MKVLLQLVGQNPSPGEFLPTAYCVRICCSIRFQAASGQINHPEVAAHDALPGFLRGGLEAHPAVFGWDLFNESNFQSTDPHTIRKYQSWLEERYGTIDNLNRKWLRRFRDFAQIDPSEHRAIYSVWSSLLPPVEIERCTPRISPRSAAVGVST